MGKKRAKTAESVNTQPAESSQAEVSSALRRKNRRRHLRALRDLVIRIALLLLVVYILFFHLVGIHVPVDEIYCLMCKTPNACLKYPQSNVYTYKCACCGNISVKHEEKQTADWGGNTYVNDLPESET